MTVFEEDIFLRNIFLYVAAEECAEELSDSKPVAISARFQREMKVMLENPKRWATRRTRPVWKKCIQTAGNPLGMRSVIGDANGGQPHSTRRSHQLGNGVV